MAAHLGGVLVPEALRFDSYRQWAEAIMPRLRAALAGEYEVVPQPPFAEAWLAFALFCYERPLSLEETIESADAIEHGIPNPDEVAWAFLRLKKRGWLAERGNLYGLTVEGRRAIEEVVGEGGTSSQFDCLKD
jgi:hypothetical protein